MLPKGGRGCADFPRGIAQLQRYSQQTAMAPSGVVLWDDHLIMQNLWALEHLFEVENGATGDTLLR